MEREGWVKPVYALGEVGRAGAFQRFYYKDMPADQKQWLAGELARIHGVPLGEFREFESRQGDRITEVTIDRTLNGEPS